jgi:hypothetical protein
MTKKNKLDEIDEAFILASVKEQSRKGTIPIKELYRENRRKQVHKLKKMSKLNIGSGNTSKRCIYGEDANLLYPLRPSKTEESRTGEYKRLSLQAPKIEDRNRFL